MNTLCGGQVIETKSDSGWSCLTVNPERHPRYDDDEVTRQVDLQQVISNLSLQPE